MKNRINKTYLYYIWLVVIAFVLIGFSATVAGTMYIIRNINDSLVDTAVKISRVATSSTDESDNFNKLLFKKNMDEYKSYADEPFVITGPNLRIYAASDNIRIPSDANIFLEGIDLNRVSTDSVNEYYNIIPTGYKTRQYMISYPVAINDMSLIIFTSYPLKYVVFSVLRIDFIIWGILLVAIATASVLIYRANETSMRQIKEMNVVADAMARGNFENRIAVEGDDEISILAENFNKMADSLAKQQSFKNEYISNISHDIRSPLTTIKGFIEAIMDGTIPPEKTHKYLEIIYNEADRLNKLGNSLLELSRLDMMKDRLQCESFDIISFMRDCAESMEDKYLRKNISVSYDFESDNLYIYADAEKMQRICYNLVDNAIKYTNNGGKICLGVKKNGSKALISVTDTGIGISEQDLPHIFERLYKVDKSRGQNKESVGLGLAIVKELVEAHGEKITAVSRLGEGTSFSFEMPLANTEE